MWLKVGSKSGFGGNVLGAAGVEAPRSTGRNPDQFPNFGEAPPPPKKKGQNSGFEIFGLSLVSMFFVKKKNTRVYSEVFLGMQILCPLVKHQVGTMDGANIEIREECGKETRGN